jgi:hypothetical protein
VRRAGDEQGDVGGGLPVEDEQVGDADGVGGGQTGTTLTALPNRTGAGPRWSRPTLRQGCILVVLVATLRA